MLLQHNCRLLQGSLPKISVDSGGRRKEKNQAKDKFPMLHKRVQGIRGANDDKDQGAKEQ